MRVSNSTLVKIAAVGGFATASMGFALRSKLNQRISETEYYQEAVDILKKHPGVIYLLGKPIQLGSIDVSNDEKNWTKTLSAHYEVPVKGPKQKGVLHFWAYRKSEIVNWKVHRMELELSNEPNKRLLVKNDKIE